MAIKDTLAIKSELLRKRFKKTIEVKILGLK